MSNVPQDVKLLPCPFCGSENFGVDEGSTFRWRIPTCNDCGATAGEIRIDTTSDKTQEQKDSECRARCIEAWNQRAEQLRDQRSNAEPVYEVHYGELCYLSDADDQSYDMLCPVTPEHKPKFPNGTKFYATTFGYDAGVAAGMKMAAEICDERISFKMAEWSSPQARPLRHDEIKSRILESIPADSKAALREYAADKIRKALDMMVEQVDCGKTVFNDDDNLRQQLSDTQRKLEAAEKQNEGRDLYAWRYARLSEKNNTQEVGVPYVVALNNQGELEHLYFGALGQACDILWPMPDRAIEQSKGGDDGSM